MYSRVKELCKRQGVSVSKLERDLQLSRGSICKWNVNTPSIDKVKAVADYFSVSVDELLGGNFDCFVTKSDSA
jgi:transcriptional regulator with XRE-family HTH domain